MKNRWLVRFLSAHEAFIKNLEIQFEHDIITEFPGLMDFYQEPRRVITHEEWLEARIKVAESMKKLEELLRE